MKFTLPNLLFILGLMSLLGGLYLRSQKSPPEIHYHAGFLVYNQGKVVDFSGEKNMYLDVCTEQPDNESANPKRNVHLHNGIGDVAHIHKDGVVWGDLFTNLEYSLPSTASAYINGQKTDSFLFSPILPYDSAVVFIGETDTIESKLQGAVTKTKIEAVETQIRESCGNR